MAISKRQDPVRVFSVSVNKLLYENCFIVLVDHYEEIIVIATFYP